MKKVQVKSVIFPTVESSYDMSNFKKGGGENKIGPITLVGKFDVSISQEELQ